MRYVWSQTKQIDFRLFWNDDDEEDEDEDEDEDDLFDESQNSSFSY